MGRRYFYLYEHFNLSGADNWSGDSESLDEKTENNLVGMQTGLQLISGWNRYQFEVEGKAGLMANFYRQHATDAASTSTGAIPAGFIPRTTRTAEPTFPGCSRSRLPPAIAWASIFGFASATRRIA